MAAFGPGLMLLWEQIAPSYVGKGGFAPIMRLAGVGGVTAGFIYFYNRSICGCYLLKPAGKRGVDIISGSAILWLQGEQAGGGDGHEGDGR